jgi:hypothetical protein
MSTKAEPEDKGVEEQEDAGTGEDTSGGDKGGVPEWFTSQMSELKSHFQSELNALKASRAEEQKQASKAAAPKQAVKKGVKDVEDPESEYEQRIIELARERDEALRKAEVTMQKAVLIQHGLRSSRFATQILSEYDGAEDFETFVEKCKKDKDLSVLFNQPTKEQPTPPAGPTGGSGPRTGNTKSAEAQLREFAEGMWPHDKRKQDAYIKNRLAMEKRA